MLILASGSPRRHGLLSLFRVDFQVHSSEVDERVITGETPQDYVLRLAISKSISINPLSGVTWLMDCRMKQLKYFIKRR